jgi:hypothetical protein
MQKTKNSHWVPQSYLRHFAADPDKREKIWRIGKIEGAPELKPIKKVAVKFYLYAPRGDDGKRDYAFEQTLSSIEQWFGTPGWHQLCTDFAPLQHEAVRKMVSLLAAIMYLRNPAQLEKTKNIHQQIVEVFAQLPELPETIEQKGRVFKVDASDWEAFRNATDDDVKRYWIDTVAAAGSLAEKLKAMRWAVVVSEMPVFIMTDHPVVFTHPSLDFRGLDNADAMVCFPLSPTRILVMDNKRNEPDGQYCPLNTTPAAYNVILWRNALHYMFSHRHPDMVCAEMDAATAGVGF